MSKKFKSQASSARAANATFGSPAFGSGASGFQTASSLSYVVEQPDLGGISDPHVVVSLRNLGKKDSTTKTKALEELQEHVQTVGSSVEDSVVTAWIVLYPRTAIDNSRRVRQLAHSLQGSLTFATGKRIVPHLSKAVGAWLCGLYDNDRTVARAAQDALSEAFTSEEKRSALWKVYRDPLLEYAEDAILVQTSGTLSDERTTSKDDADSKYARVVGSALYMLGQLIRSVRQEEIKTQSTSSQEKSARILREKKLWEFVHHNDPYLRRSSCSLASLCGQDPAPSLDWTVLSTAFVSKGLQASQLGSAGQFSGALLALTKIRPEIWTSDYHAKTPSSKRLLQFLRRGSQRGPEEVWTNVRALFVLIPFQVFANPDGDFSLVNASEIAGALHEGVTNSEEPRQNLLAGWACYVESGFTIESHLIEATARETFYHEHLASIVFQYVEPLRSASSTPQASTSALITAVTLYPLQKGLDHAFDKLWVELGSLVVEKIKLSLPESSNAFSSSQEAVVKVSDRLFKLEKDVLDNLSSSPTQHNLSNGSVSEGLATLERFSQHIIKTSISVLKNRNGKPYGAAAVLKDAASMSNLTHQAKEDLYRFSEHDAPQLMHSPSSELLVKLTAALEAPLAPLLRSLIESPELNDHGSHALNAILSIISQDEAESIPELTVLLMKSLHDTTSNPNSVLLPSAILRNWRLERSSIVVELFETLLKNLSTDLAQPTQQHAMDVVQATFLDHPSTTDLISENWSNKLISKLLLFSESVDQEISERASTLLEQLKSSKSADRSGRSATAAIIGDQLSGSVPQLSILALVELAVGEISGAGDKSTAANVLLPTNKQWVSALAPHMTAERPFPLAITSPLQGAVYFIDGETTQRETILRDFEGFSLVFRFALYTTRLLSSTDLIEMLNESTLQSLFLHYPLALQLINEKLTMDSANGTWIDGTPEVLDEAADVVSQGSTTVQNWAISRPSFTNTIRERWNLLQENDPTSYYTGLFLSDLAAKLLDRDGIAQIFPSLESEVRLLHRSTKLLRSVILASCAREYIITSTTGRKALNELISNATEVKLLDSTANTLHPMVMLNVVLNGDSGPLEGIQSQRLVFLMQNLVRILGSTSNQTGIVSEVLKLLCVVLPAVRDIYGDHWQQVLEKLVQIWESIDDLENNLPVLNSSLRLYQRLKALTTSEEANEDLVEVWNELTPRLDEGLLQCLSYFEHASVGLNQPRQITAELLGRLLAAVDIKPEDIPSTTSLLWAKEDAVVEAAYKLLHRAIPERQEQLSIELALEKEVINLSTELMSIIGDEIPVSARTPLFSTDSKRYLLSWKLVLDHFGTASYKLRESYASELKGAAQIPPLLGFICEAIQITSGRPFDVSKLEFEDFILGGEESDEREMQKLSVHIYYQCLLYVPSLVKAWYIEQKNRIRSPLQAWTQKYISQSIVSASLAAVVGWAKTQDSDDTPVEVKTSPRSSELVASMAIDPESPPISIAVALPGSYPLESPTVVSRTRVGVSEKNWQAWLRTVQIIIFSTGSVIEGLVAFRRNVQGALKNHAECAICYSIIGTDMQTPNKKCGTCKNTFHGSCLFRWFKSSNSSSCPLCRNNFNYA